MRKEEEIREKIYKKLNYVLREKDHNKMMMDLTWINALNWVLDTEKDGFK